MTYIRFSTGFLSTLQVIVIHRLNELFLVEIGVTVKFLIFFVELPNVRFALLYRCCSCPMRQNTAMERLTRLHQHFCILALTIPTMLKVTTSHA